MFVSGMTSVTFRKRNVSEIVAVCKRAGLAGVEWGGDVHVPPGSSAAHSVRKICEGEGIRIFSYGSYFSVTGTDYLGDFEKIAETCGRLGTKIVRIWATRGWFDDATREEYENFIGRMKNISDLATDYGLTVCFEHHQKTFCDCLCHTRRVLDDIGRSNVKTYWQPICSTYRDNLLCAKNLKDQVVCIHVYNWKGSERWLLLEGRENWQRYLSVFAKEEREIPCLLEFAKDDCEACFLADAECLRQMLDSVCAE